MVARLLLTVAPEAELYIAKVSNQSKMPKNQLHRIASVRDGNFHFMSRSRRTITDREAGHKMGPRALAREYHLDLFST